LSESFEVKDDILFANDIPDLFVGPQPQEDGLTSWPSCVHSVNILAQNIIRRHLMTGQKAMIAAEIANLPRGGDRKSKELKNGNPILKRTEAAKLPSYLSPAARLFFLSVMQ
jgi:hypothetical protein